MKTLKTFLTLCIALALFGCAQERNSFTLQGTYTGNESPMLYLAYTDIDGNRIIDSTTVVSGKFEFNGTIAEPTMVTLWMGDRQGRNERHRASFFIDPKTMKISIDEADFSEYVLTGSPTNTLAKKLDEDRQELRTQMGDLRRKIRDLSDGAEKNAAQQELDLVSEKISAINVEFMKKNPNSVVSAYTLRFSLSSLGYQTAMDLYNSFSPKVQNSHWGQQTYTDLQRILRGQPGQKAQLFVRTDINGNELNLHELNKDNYLLINFWASWCGPCRSHGNPHLLKLHKKYGDKGLLIVAVSDNDSSPNDWKQAIEQDGIGEFRHILRGLRRTADGFDRSEDLSENFGNSVLPTKYLIDKNGIILLRITGTDKTDLDAKLKEIFGF